MLRTCLGIARLMWTHWPYAAIVLALGPAGAILRRARSGLVRFFGWLFRTSALVAVVGLAVGFAFWAWWPILATVAAIGVLWGLGSMRVRRRRWIRVRQALRSAQII
jgi:hypothetical protein